MAFAHLHVHTEYSLLDGACRIGELVSAAKELGQTSIAITDHGVMYGAVSFFAECKKQGIKPIIGCEIYLAQNSRFETDKRAELDCAHLVLLCKNEVGYKNLIQIVSKAYTEGFYSKPRADLELLSEHSEGLVALSACLGGVIPQYILAGKMNEAEEYAQNMCDIFGKENFYLELQQHGLEGQTQVNAALLSISSKLGIGLVATNDVHYVKKQDSESQAVLVCIQTNTKLSEKNVLGFETDEFYLKSEEEMSALFRAFPNAIENTEKIANMCNFEFDFSNTFLPAYSVPDGLTSAQYLEKLCYEGFERRLAKAREQGRALDEEEYKNRIEYELSVICQMGYAEYYLIVNDVISYAKSQNIPVGPGRGSGAGSLVAFCLGITDVDSIQYNLLFERFLNPERVSMPDFDIDFCYNRRSEVIEYVARKYGADHVSQIITFGTLAARAVIRDVGRALDMPYSDVDTVAKLVPARLDITIEKAIEESEQLKQMYAEDSYIARLLNISKSLEGMPRHASTHAAGIVITDKPVSHYVPLASNHGTVVTQYTMNDIADLGLLKIDFLGLKYLTIIDDAQKFIKQKNPKFDIYSIPLDDKETYRFLSSGNTDGVFQLESGGMKSLLTRLKPQGIEDITAAISLYRPGPMDSIPKYIENRKNPDKIKYINEDIREILSVTNGCIIYQEQVMQIFRKVAGYSYGEADIVRRAMAKKKKEVMEREHYFFVHGKDDGKCEGAIKRGMSKESAEALYSEMADFAKYAFNKSHAASYAFISYRTAFLKCHYPQEYMASLLTNSLDFSGKVAKYITVCKSLGIEVLPPDINKSFSGFTPEGKNLRFGFLAIKNVGESFIENVISERTKNGEYKSFEDFLLRLCENGINKRMIESLIMCGTFDSFGKGRKALLLVFESALEKVARIARSRNSGQLDFFADTKEEAPALVIDYPQTEELTMNEMLAMEKEMANFYFSGHPLLEYLGGENLENTVNTDDIYSSFSDSAQAGIKEHQKVKLIGIVRGKKVKQTRNDARMAFVDFEDICGNIELIVFPKVYEKYAGYLAQDKVVCVIGEVSVKDSDQGESEMKQEPKIIVNSISPAYPAKEKENIKENKEEQKSEVKLYIKAKNIDDKSFKSALSLLEIFPGKSPVFVYFEDTEKLVRYREMYVDLNPTLEKALKDTLGEKNIAKKY